MIKTNKKKLFNPGVFYLFLVLSIVIHLFILYLIKSANRENNTPPKEYNVKITFQYTGESPVDKLVAEGRQASETGDMGKALESYNKALNFDKDNKKALLGRGIALAKTGNLDQAMKDFESLKKSSPDKPEGYYGTAMVLAKQDMYDKALVEIDTALKMDPGNPQYLSDRGYMLIFTKDLDKAKSDFTEALDADPENPFANAGMGEYYRRTNDLKAGAGYYEKAIKIDDHIPKTHQFLASIYFDQDRFQESLRYYDLELAKVKRYGRVDDFQEGACYAEMARISAMLDNPEAAEKYIALFFKSVRKTDLYEAENDEHLSLLSDAGNAYIEMGAHNPKYYKDALLHYKRALDFPKRSSKMKMLYHNFQVGWCYWEMRKAETAMKYFQETQKYLPEYYSRFDYWMQGHVLMLQGKYDEALKKFEESLKVDPEFENAYLSRGMTLYLMGENDRALKDLDMVIRLRGEKKALQIIYKKAVEVKKRIDQGKKGTLENIRDI